MIQKGLWHYYSFVGSTFWLKIIYRFRSGASGDVYIPNLWYYNELLFLTDHEEIRDSSSNFENNSTNQDSLITVLITVQERLDEYVDDSDERFMHVVIMSGAWVEFMYLGAQGSEGNERVHHQLSEQMILLEKYGAASVSKRNSHGKLPIDMLWESNEISDRESVEYVGSVFQLLKAYPEIVMNFDARAIQKNQDGTGKKRKYESE